MIRKAAGTGEYIPMEDAEGRYDNKAKIKRHKDKVDKQKIQLFAEQRLRMK